MISCPSPSQLEFCFERLLADPDRCDDFADHVEDCSVCQARLESMLDEESVAGRHRTTGSLPPTIRAVPESARGGDTTRLPLVPGYELLVRLGRGGMGVVYKARHRKLDRLVALEMIRAEIAGVEQHRRFQVEAEAIARLQHPNIVQIHEVAEYDGMPCLALELVEGGTLADRLDHKPIPPREAAALLRTLAHAMQAAHAAGVVHRDLKPANVLLTADGTLKVTDFGLAKKLDASAGPTLSGQVMGTPDYMAPEQTGGTKEVGPPADIWALGAILYECLTGRIPFAGASPLDTMRQVNTDEPAAPSSLQRRIPRDLETVCLKCLNKVPARRYASALELAEDLERFLSGRPGAGLRLCKSRRTIRRLQCETAGEGE